MVIHISQGRRRREDLIYLVGDSEVKDRMKLLGKRILLLPSNQLSPFLSFYRIQGLYNLMDISQGVGRLEQVNRNSK